MSVNGTPFLVDWDELRARFKPGDKLIEPIVQPHFDAPPASWIEWYDTEDWNNNWHAAAEASELYHALRDHLPVPTRDHLDEFCSALFWHETTDVQNDLGPLHDGIALSPLSVAKALGAYQRVTRADYSSAYARVQPPAPSWFDKLSDFEEYLAMFGRLLTAAAHREWGIVLWIG